jgi:hypothetical protein
MFVADYARRHPGRHLDTVTAWAETSGDHIRARYPVNLPHTQDALDDARGQAAVCRLIREAARPSGA